MENFKRRVDRYQSTTFGEHRYGIGKHFLKKKNVYLEDKLAKPLDAAPVMKEYLDKCIAEGLEINKLEFGLFQAKNGFQYEGFRATEEINSSDILIKVPKKLVLNTKICLFSDIQIIVKENLKFFNARKGGLVEDHIMLVFLLRQYQLGKASPWYHLISNLSKQIDTVDFWEDDEYKYLDDPVFRERIRLQRNYFNYIVKNLQEILPKYPDLFEKETYSEANIRWIYIHIWSRCFGGSMDYVSMVPIVEMMNHENTNMFFRIHKEGSEIEKVDITQEEILNHTSTENESYQSEDNVFANEGDLEEYDELKALAEQKMIKVDQSNPKLKDIKRHCLELEQSIINDFNFGDDVSIFFASKILEKLRKIEQTTVLGKKKPNKIQEEIQRLKQLCTFFKELIKSYHKEKIKENVVINTSQKKIFEQDAKEAEQTIKEKAKETQQTVEVAKEETTEQDKPEVIEAVTTEIKVSETTQNTDIQQLNNNEQQENGEVKLEHSSENNEQNKTEDALPQPQEVELKQDQTQEIENKQEQTQGTENKQEESQKTEEKQEQKDDENNSSSSADESESEEEVEEKKEKEEEKKEIVVTGKEYIVEQRLNDLELQYSDNPKDWKEVDYDNFILMADGSDRFEKGAQVYFCYNRLSNRSMLSKYGMALEYNKYEFVHLRYQFINDIVEFAPYALSYIKYFELTKYKRFIIAYSRFNTKILSFAKSMFWDLETQSVEAIFIPTISITLEIKGLEKVKQIYQEYLNSRMYTMEQNEDMLDAKEMNGHLYFATIYRLERQKVIKNQLNLVNIVITTLQQMLEQGEMGRSFFEKPTQFDEDPKDNEFFNRNRYMLRKYIKLFPEQNKQF